MTPQTTKYSDRWSHEHAKHKKNVTILSLSPNTKEKKTVIARKAAFSIHSTKRKKEALFPKSFSLFLMGCTESRPPQKNNDPFQKESNAKQQQQDPSKSSLNNRTKKMSSSPHSRQPSQQQQQPSTASHNNRPDPLLLPNPARLQQLADRLADLTALAVQNGAAGRSGATPTKKSVKSYNERLTVVAQELAPWFPSHYPFYGGPAPMDRQGQAIVRAQTPSWISCCAGSLLTAWESLEATHGDGATRLLLERMAMTAISLPHIVMEDEETPNAKGRWRWRVDEPVVHLTRAQCLAVLCNAFFCTFPRASASCLGVEYTTTSVDDDDEDDSDGEEVAAHRNGKKRHRATHNSDRDEDDDDENQPSEATTTHRFSTKRQLPSINFDELFFGEARQSPEGAKLRMILDYFWWALVQRVDAPPAATATTSAHRKQEEGPRSCWEAEVVTFLKHQCPPTMSSLPVSSSSSAPDSIMRLSQTPLCQVQFQPLRHSIDDASHALRVDFANAMIGGASLAFGNVQEEILFALCPELNVARLFFTPMADHEAIVLLHGAQYSTLKPGTYGGTMAHGGAVPEGCRRLAGAVLAVDACDYRGAQLAAQYRHYPREVEKLLAAFTAPVTDPEFGVDPGDAAVVATGNWGCGVFRGDTLFKCLVQWFACSIAGKSMAYFPFDHQEVSKLGPMMQQAVGTHCNCQQLRAVLEELGGQQEKKHRDGNRGSQNLTVKEVLEMCRKHLGTTV